MNGGSKTGSSYIPPLGLERKKSQCACSIPFLIFGSGLRFFTFQIFDQKIKPVEKFCARRMAFDMYIYILYIHIYYIYTV